MSAYLLMSAYLCLPKYLSLYNRDRPRSRYRSCFNLLQNYPFDKHVCHFGFRPRDFGDGKIKLVPECVRYSEEEQGPKVYNVDVFAKKLNRDQYNKHFSSVNLIVLWMDQCTFVFATRGHCIKGKQCQHVVLKNKISVCVQNNLACFPFLHYPLVANRKACWSITTKLWVKPLNQCNQMAILFFQYITIIFNNENLPSR